MAKLPATKVRMPTAPKLPKMPGIANPKAPKQMTGGLKGYINASRVLPNAKQPSARMSKAI